MTDFSKKSLTEIQEMLSDGMVISFTGRQGCGKSTAMKMIGKLFKDCMWRVEIVDEDEHELLVIAPKSILDNGDIHDS